MKRCEHGVMVPSWSEGNTSPYCSGCTVPDKGSIITKITPFSPFPGGVKACPECGVRKGFSYKDEYEWHCKKCGADALDPNG